jgi:hypothetical protein
MKERTEKRFGPGRAAVLLVLELTPPPPTPLLPVPVSDSPSFFLVDAITDEDDEEVGLDVGVRRP